MTAITAGRRVYKYPLTFHPLQSVEMPYGAVVRHVHEQGGAPCLWVEVNTSAPMVVNHFIVVATGQEVPVGATYVGTVHVKWTVWHVFLLRDNGNEGARS